MCCGPGCIPKGARKVYDAFVEAGRASGEKDVVVAAKLTGCQGLCECGPLVTVDPGSIFYQGVGEEDVAEISREIGTGRPGGRKALAPQ